MATSSSYFSLDVTHGQAAQARWLLVRVIAFAGLRTDALAHVGRGARDTAKHADIRLRGDHWVLGAIAHAHQWCGT
jgi:hypothetical protein